MANDTDPDSGETFKIDSVTPSAGFKGIVTNNVDSIDYDPNSAFGYLEATETATETFTYTMSDSHGATSTATVTVTINGAGVNSAPTAVNDTGAVDEAGPATTITVLANDTDPDTDPVPDTLSVLSFDDTLTKGTVTNNGDGTFDYNPNGQFDYLEADQTATDTFTYTITDGHGGTDTATVTITIAGVSSATPPPVEPPTPEPEPPSVEPPSVQPPLEPTDPVIAIESDDTPVAVEPPTPSVQPPSEPTIDPVIAIGPVVEPEPDLPDLVAEPDPVVTPEPISDNESFSEPDYYADAEPNYTLSSESTPFGEVTSESEYDLIANVDFSTFISDMNEDRKVTIFTEPWENFSTLVAAFMNDFEEFEIGSVPDGEYEANWDGEYYADLGFDVSLGHVPDGEYGVSFLDESGPLENVAAEEGEPENLLADDMDYSQLANLDQVFNRHDAFKSDIDHILDEIAAV